MLNRGVLIVRPKQPYLGWAAALDDSGILADPSGEQTVYLVREFGDDDEAQHVLKTVDPEVLERELFGWHRDEAAWPKHRDFKTFKAWFSVGLHSVVEDQSAEDLIDDELNAQGHSLKDRTSRPTGAAKRPVPVSAERFLEQGPS